MSKKVAIVVTGASRGFGRALALVASQMNVHDLASKKPSDGNVGRSSLNLVLVARSSSGLDETKQMIHELLQDASARDMDINISCHTMDLSDLVGLDKNLDTILQENLLEDCERVILFNNAGSVGFLGPSVESPSLQDMRQNIDLNITSSLWTSVRFSKWAVETSTPCTLVNISSLVAVADFPTFGIYSAGKAARDKYHTLMSKEMAAGTKDSGATSSECLVRTLNYAPGPLETEMVEEIRRAPELDSELKPHFQKQLLDPKDSAKKVIRLLESDDFESGAHVDYYDLPEL